MIVKNLTLICARMSAGLKHHPLSPLECRPGAEGAVQHYIHALACTGHCCVQRENCCPVRPRGWGLGLGGLGERDWVKGREVTSDRQGKLPEPGRRTWGGCQPGQMAETLQGQRGGEDSLHQMDSQAPLLQKAGGPGALPCCADGEGVAPLPSDWGGGGAEGCGIHGAPHNQTSRVISGGFGQI